MKKTLFKKALSLALTMSMVLSMVGSALANPRITADPSKYAAQIQTAQAKGLMVGYGDGNFGEDDPTNRAMFVTILENMCGGIVGIQDKTSKFTDVKTTDWFADGVAWAMEKNIVEGYPDNTFRGTQTITREELAVMVYKYAQDQNLGGKSEQTVSLSQYTDGAQISDWAQTAYRWCLANGILQPNEDSTLDSDSEVNRGETAAAVVALAQIGKRIPVSTSGGSENSSRPSQEVEDFNSYTETLAIDWSQAAQLPLTGWFTKAIGEERSVKVYIPEEASIRSYFTVVAVPDGVDTYQFLKNEGWMALADEKGEGLFVLEPGEKGWGSVEEENTYINAAISFLKSGKNDAKVNVFSTYGEFYLVGYEGGAAPLEAWSAENPIFVIGQVYLDGESAGADCLAQRSAAEYNGETSGYGTLENLDESLESVGLGGRITRADVPVPTWLVGYAADSDSISHWMAANDCLNTSVDGVFWQDINSKAYQTEYANRRILAQNPDAQYGISQVKITDEEPDAKDIYAFLSQYTRYDNSFAYSNMLTWRLDYTAARVEAQKQAAQGRHLATLQGEAGPVDILGQSDVILPGHGTVQVGIFSFSDNNGDGTNDPREYLLFLPEGFEGKELPVAMVFPGNTQTDSIFMDCTPWWEIAEEEGVALVMVCETYSAATAVTHIDAEGYYHAAIALLEQQIDGVYAELDLTRIYGAGQSRGSRTVQNFARSNPEFFAAVASTSGVGDVNDKDLPPAQGVGGLIPSSQVGGQNDMAYLEPDLWGSDSLVEWGNYLLEVNGAVGDLENWTTLERSGRYSTYTWDNPQGIPVFQWIECQVRAHNCYPDDVWANWEYVKYFRLAEDGTRYYSPSAFAEDDAVVILSSASDYSYQQSEEQVTRYGILKGFEQDGALHWFGVPYAQAPVGELRWKELQPLQPWEGVLNATESQFASQMSGENLVGSEEGAVTLDITRPDTDETDLPIFFYIHGGNNQTGKSSAFPATQFVQETNCIVVSVNHRLGLLGFNALPALKNGTAEENSGNYALLDLATALDWVKENAESFGGDGENITITGSSAGGRDVMAMLISPIFEGKFQKAISYSGGMTIADVEDSQLVEARALAPLVVAKGVKTTEEAAAEWLLTDAQEVRDFLYGLTDQELASAFGSAGIRMSAFPHLFNDGVVLPAEGFETENYVDVPLMMVTGSSEFSTFCKGSGAFGRLSDDDLLADEEMLKQYRFAENYGSMMYGYFNAEESAERMFPHYQSPIYTCDVDWGENADVVGEKMAEIYGSYHCMTTPLMTHVLYTASLKFPEVFAQEGCLAVSAMLNQYYSNFLWNGDPNGEGLVPWDAWSSLDGTTQLLVDGDQKRAWAVMSTEHTSYEEIIALMEADDTISDEQKSVLIQSVMNGRWFSAAMDEYYGNADLWK